ncbi:MAG: TldE/PmbA family protein [Betaproteobacteria bacterium]|nr:TldE/PmbA family protein [Betaproteobacteria bacterium]
MKSTFLELADFVQSLAAAGEVIASGFNAETSDFIRFNKSAVRQATSVRQARWTLTLIRDGRRVDAAATLSGQPGADRDQLKAMLSDLRSGIAQAPVDPYLLYPTTPVNTERESIGEIPDASVVMDAVLDAGRGLDLVGLYAGGPIHEGFANSLGQRNWQRVDNFNFEWCLYHDRDKAVKTSYSGPKWEADAFAARMRFARDQLALLGTPARTLDPGHYRAYLAPSAMEEVLGMLCWGGFGLKSQRTKHSPLMRMADGKECFDARVTIAENTAEGLATGFQREGFVRPGRVELIRAGRPADTLVSPRSAKEYGAATNGANGDETPESLDLAAGELPRADALNALDRGIFVGNLWYLNFSDRSACRLTGMTRFASFWVEGGKIRAPLNVMRFDDSAFRILGSELEALTKERDLLLQGGTYGLRNTSSMRTPGALLRDFALVL